ncbi:MAG TPA: GNAT family N-acetyltransferase [Gammaproteobacteria bacterium]|nr:GNAT family N-acetyltransferase [Gammaproteobacteria bacterium]
MSALSFKQSLTSLPTLAPAHELYYRCERAGGYSPKLYWQTLRERHHDLNSLDYLCFTDDKLIGMLNIFFFSDIAEISVLVDPDYRHQGIFKKLLMIGLTKLRNYIVNEYMFIVNDKNEKFIEECIARKGTLDHREVEMRPRENISLESEKKITLSRATFEDLDVLADLHVQAFEKPDYDAIKDRFGMTLKEPNRKAYLARNEKGEVVGKIHAREDFNRIYVHDVGIAKKFRQQGYGKALMLTWLKEYSHEYAKPIAVEVLGDNTAALKLYDSCGFETTNRYSFYRFPL